MLHTEWEMLWMQHERERELARDAAAMLKVRDSRRAAPSRPPQRGAAVTPRFLVTVLGLLPRRRTHGERIRLEYGGPPDVRTP